MRHSGRITRTTAPVALLILGVGLATIPSCGGATSGDGVGNGNAGTGAQAGASGSSGSSGAGGVPNTGGAAGSADDGPGDLCLLPPDPGSCLAHVPSYYHEPETGLCEPFSYGGCGGNENRFDTMQACQDACDGGTPNMDVCDAPSDCVLEVPQCCGGCDPVDRSAFVALNRMFTGEFSRIRGCDVVDCAGCMEVGELLRKSQYFVATCESNRCGVVDIRETPATECNVDADCFLRDGASCCEECDGSGIVAASTNGALHDLVCDAEPVACPPCAPVLPAALKAACSSGRCTVSL